MHVNVEDPSALTALRSLTLSCWYIGSLTNAEGQISNITVASLTALQSLDLSRHKQLSDLAPLSALLHSDSSRFVVASKIEDLTPLASLRALRLLDLGVQ